MSCLGYLAAISTRAAADPVEAPQHTPTRSEAIELRTPTSVLSGTLDVPPRMGPWPVVLLIAGSGPTDRGGNQQRALLFNDALKQLGRGLAARRVAAFRYDRRGVGESAAAAPEEKDFRIEMLADDAAAWITMLRDDGRFSTVAIAGHSEGSLVGMLAAGRSAPDGFVSLAGPGRPFAEVLRDQLQRNLDGDLRREALRIVDELVAGRTVEVARQEFALLFRPSVQPYRISTFRYDPARELASLSVPVLVVQGTTDARYASALPGFRMGRDTEVGTWASLRG